MNYYLYGNATRRLKVDGIVFNFEVCDNVGGAWYGVLALSDEAKIATLATVAARLGISEIDEPTYQDFLKKKTKIESLLVVSKPTNDTGRKPCGSCSYRHPSN